MLKDQTFSAEVARVLAKMKPIRQVECVELMISANTELPPIFLDTNLGLNRV